MTGVSGQGSMEGLWVGFVDTAVVLERGEGHMHRNGGKWAEHSPGQWGIWRQRTEIRSNKKQDFGCGAESCFQPQFLHKMWHPHIWRPMGNLEWSPPPPPAVMPCLYFTLQKAPARWKQIYPTVARAKVWWKSSLIHESPAKNIFQQQTARETRWAWLLRSSVSTQETYSGGGNGEHLSRGRHGKHPTPILNHSSILCLSVSFKETSPNPSQIRFSVFTFI